METTTTFLERLRASLGGASGCSDYRLAKVLQISHTTVWGYLKKGRAMDDAVAIRCASLLDLDPVYVVACCHAERSTNVETTRLWEEIAAKFAASVLFAMPLMSLINWRF